MTDQLSLLNTQKSTETISDDPILAGLNPEQRRAASQPVTTGVKVLAGAGTGKTELISRRFLFLSRALKNEGVPRATDRILALTFTDEAASSMKEKINKSLKKYSEETLGAEAWVSTFHAFSNRILRNHAYWLGRTRDFELLDDLNKQVVFMRILKEIREGHCSDISEVLAGENLTGISSGLLDLESLQWLQVEAGLESLDDLLSVSSVKGLIDKIKSSGKSPRQFYDDSLVQLDRLTQAFANLPCEHDPELKPSENASEYIRQWYTALKHWIGNDWTPYQEDAQKAAEIIKPFEFLKKAYTESGAYTKGYPPVYFDSEPLKSQQKMATHCLQMLTVVYALYQKTLREKNLCDYDDLINLTIQLFSEHPSLRKQYQDQFNHIIVDEFQDSNGSQLQLLKLLLNEAHTNLTVVGDVKQSIYGFRYAQPENMDLVFQTDKGIRPHEKIHLPTNYRSNSAILKTANVITEAITGDDSQFLYPDKPEQKRNEKTNPDVEWLTLGALGEPDEKGKQKEEAIVFQKEKESRFIAQKIAELVTENNYQFKDIAILVKGHTKANDIQAVLNDCGIPSVLQKNKGFFQTPPIKDAMAALRLMKNVYDESSLVRLLQGKLSQSEMAQLCWLVKEENSEQETSLIEVLQSIDTYAEGLGKDKLNISEERLSAVQYLANSLVVLRKRQPRLTPLQMFLTISDHIGLISPSAPAWQKVQYRQQLKTFERFLFYLCGRSPITPTLGEVLDVVEEYQKNPNLELPLEEAGESENAVRIMTVHASKGLDFKVVFVAGVDGRKPPSRNHARLNYEPQYEGLNGYGLFLTKWQGENTLPQELYSKTWNTPREESEAKRVFYVALTRAEEKMFVLTSYSAGKDWMKGDFYTHEELIHHDEQTEEGAAYLEKHHWHRSLPSFDKLSDGDVITLPEELVDLSTDEVSAEAGLNLSFSAINTFEECPVKYWLRYQWRLPEPKESPYSTNLGTGLHGLIQKHFVYQGKVDQSLATQILESWFPKSSSYEISEMLTLYEQFCSSEYSYNALSTSGYKILPEKRIRFPWKTKSAETDVMIDIDGVLDLLLYSPQAHQFKLIDFKTNKALDAEKVRHYSEQLKLYQSGMHYLHPDIPLPDENVSLVHLTPQGLINKPIDKSATVEQLETVIDQIASAYGCEGSPSLPYAGSNPPCKSCAYITICPQAKG